MSSEAKSSSEHYKVLARKYRPQNFDDLIGQTPMVRTLTNAFETGRIAQAYMLTGVRGVGKTTTARILARALNYKTDEIDQPTVDIAIPGEHCQAIMEGRHVDIIEMDAASHTGIDDIRDLIESAQYKPVSARYKVYIIDEVHMLSKNAFNGLLKTLEEPPQHLKFVFATTEIRKVPITVLSRCQRFDLRRIESSEMVDHLSHICEKESVTVDDEPLAMIARASEGSVRDALSMLDQAISHGAGNADTKVDASTVRNMLGLSDRGRIIELFEHLMSGNVQGALEELKAQYDIGAEPFVVLTDLADFVHFVTKLKYVDEAAKDKSLSEIEHTKGIDFAEKLSVRVLGRTWQILLKGISEVQSSERALQAADMVLIRIAHAADLPTPDELIRKLQKEGASAPAGSSALGTTSGGDGVSSPNQPISSNHSPNGAPTMDSAAGSTMNSAAGMGDGRPKLVANGGDSRAQAPRIDVEVQSDATPNIVLNSFDELIFLVEDQRDLQLKTYLRRNVRPVNFSSGKIELQLVGNPPKTFLTDLSQKLHKWTGHRWMIATSQQEGQPTLEEQEQAENLAQVEFAKSDPLVESILSAFPGSKIVDVRIRAEPEIETGMAHDLEDPGADSLDDFFE